VAYSRICCRWREEAAFKLQTNPPPYTFFLSFSAGHCGSLSGNFTLHYFLVHIRVALLVFFFLARVFISLCCSSSGSQIQPHAHTHTHLVPLFFPGALSLSPIFVSATSFVGDHRHHNRSSTHDNARNNIPRMPLASYAIQDSAAANDNSDNVNIKNMSFEVNATMTADPPAQGSSTATGVNPTTSITNGVDHPIPAAPASRHAPQKATGITRNAAAAAASQRVESAGALLQVTLNAPLASFDPSVVELTTADQLSTIVSNSRPSTTTVLAAEAEKKQQQQEGNAMSLSPNFLIDRNTLRRDNQHFNLIKPATASAAASSAPSQKPLSAPPPLELRDIKDATVSVPPQHEREQCESARHSSTTSPGPSPPSQACDTARTQVYHPPRIFNRGGRTEVISVHSSSNSGSSSSGTDSVTIHFNIHDPPTFSTSPTHASRRVGNRPAPQEASKPTTAAVHTGAKADVHAAVPPPVMPDPCPRSGRVSRRSLAGPRTTTSSIDSQPPPLTDMTHAPGSLADSSWDNSLVDVTNASDGSATVPAGEAATTTQDTAAAITTSDKGSATTTAAASPSGTAPSSFSASSLTRSVRRGAGRETQARLARLPDGTASIVSAGSGRSVRAAVFYDSPANSDGKTRAAPPATAPPPKENTKTEAPSCTHGPQVGGNRRRAPPVYRSRMSSPTATVTATAQPAATTMEEGSASPDHAEVEDEPTTLHARIAPHFASSSPARPPLPERRATAQRPAAAPTTSAAAVLDPSGSRSDGKPSVTTSPQVLAPPSTPSTPPQAADTALALFTAPSSRPASKGDASLLDTSDYLEASEGSPLKQQRGERPSDLQEQEAMQQPPPTTRSPVSLSASARSREALLSLDNLPQAVRGESRNISSTLPSDVTTPAAHMSAAAFARTTRSSPSLANSARPILSSNLSAHPPVETHGDNNGSGCVPVIAPVTNVAQLSPFGIADLSQLEQSPSLPHSTRPVAEVSIFEDANQHSQLNRDGEISVPRLTMMLNLPAIHAGRTELPFFGSPLGTAVTTDTASGSTSEYYYRHPAPFTAAPQLVPEASQEFFVRAAQRVCNTTNVNSPGGGSDGGSIFMTGPPTARGGLARPASMPVPMMLGNAGGAALAALEQQRAVARQILLEENDSSPSEYHFDIRSTASAPHQLMALVLDARRLPAPAAETTSANAEERQPDRSDETRAGVGSTKELTQTQAPSQDERVLPSPNHSVEEEVNMMAARPSPVEEADAAAEGRQRAADLLGISHSSGGTPPVLSAQPTQPSLSPTIEAAAAYRALTAADTNTVNNTISCSSNNSHNAHSNSSPHRRGHNSGSDGRTSAARALAVAAPGEAVLIPSHPFASPTPLATDLVPALTALLSSTDMSGSAASSAQAPSPQPVLQQPQPPHKQESGGGSTKTHAHALDSPCASQAAVLQSGEAYRYGSLSTSPRSYTIKIAPSPPCPTPAMMRTATTTAAAAVRDSLMSSQPSAVSGHSMAIMSEVASLEWSTSLPPPPPPAPPPRLCEAHTYMPLQQRSEEDERKRKKDEATCDVKMPAPTPSESHVEGGAAASPSSRVRQFVQGTASEVDAATPLVEGRAPSAASLPHEAAKAGTAPVTLPARTARTVLRVRTEKTKKTKPRSAQLPPPVPPRYVTNDKASVQLLKEAAAPLTTTTKSTATELEEKATPRSTGPQRGEPHDEKGAQEETSTEAAPTTASTRATAAALIDANSAVAGVMPDERTSASSAAAASISTASLLSPPQTVEPSHSLPRQAIVLSKLVTVTHTGKFAPQQGDRDTRAGPAVGIPLPETATPVAEASTAAPVQSALMAPPSLPPPPPPQRAAKPETSPVAAVAPASSPLTTTTPTQESLTEKGGKKAQAADKRSASASPSPAPSSPGAQRSRRLAVRKLPARERTSRLARAAAALPMQTKTASAVLTATPVQLSSARDSPVRAASPHRRTTTTTMTMTVTSGPAVHPLRDVTAITAYESVAPTFTTPHAFTTRVSPLRRGGDDRAASPRVQELPSSPDSSNAPSSHPADLQQEALEAPHALPVYHTQQSASTIPTIHAAAGTSRNHIISPAPSATHETRRGAEGITSATTSAAAATTMTWTAVKAGAVATSPYTRPPTYNRPQALPTAATGPADQNRGDSHTQEAGWGVVRVEGEAQRAPAAQSPPRRATRLASSSSAKKTPRSSQLSWTAREAQLVSTPGTDFAPSVIPATTGTVDSRASTPETSALMHALEGDWTPLRQRDKDAVGTAARETTTTASALPSSQPQQLLPSTRRSKKQMRSKRTGTAAARLLPTNAPRAPTRLLSSSPSATRDCSVLQQQNQHQQEWAEGGVASAASLRRESRSRPHGQPTPLPKPLSPADIFTSPAAPQHPSSPPHSSPSSASGERAHRHAKTSPSASVLPQHARALVQQPQRRTAATSPPQHRVSQAACPSTSMGGSRAGSASPGVKALVDYTNVFHESPPLTPAPELAGDAQRVLRTSVGSQTDPAPFPRTAPLLPSPHTYTATSHTPPAVSPPSECVSPSPATLHQAPTLLKTPQPARQPSPPTTPKRTRGPSGGGVVVNVLATPPATTIGLLSPEQSRGVHNAAVVREVLPRTSTSFSRHGSPAGSSQQSSVPSSCLQTHQRQAGYRSNLPRTLASLTLTPDPMVPTGLSPVPAVLPQRPHSVEATEMGKRRSGPFGGLGALGQMLIPLWWRKGRRRSSSTHNSKGSSPTAEAVPLSSQQQQPPRPQGGTAPRRTQQKQPPPSLAQQQRKECYASPSYAGRTGVFLYAVQPTPEVHERTDYYTLHQVQQAPPPRRNSAPPRLPPPDSMQTPAGRESEPTTSRFPATPPGLQLHTQPPANGSVSASANSNNNGARRLPTVATAGQPLQSLSSTSVAAVGMSASADSLPGGRERVTNYYGAYQWSLHPGANTPASHISPSPLLSNTPPSFPRLVPQSQQRQKRSSLQLGNSAGSSAAAAGVPTTSGEKDLVDKGRQQQRWGGANVGSTGAASRAAWGTPCAAETCFPAVSTQRGVRNIPFHGIRPRLQQQHPAYSSPNGKIDDDDDVDNDDNGVRGAEDTSADDFAAPRLTRALLDTFQQAQAAASTPPTSSPQPQRNYAASQAYLTNPHYAEQQARAAETTRRTTGRYGLQVEEIIPVLSAPSRGRCRTGASPPRPGDAPSYHGGATNRAFCRGTTAPVVPEAAPRAASPTAVPATSARPAQSRTAYSPSPPPIAPCYTTGPPARPHAAAHVSGGSPPPRTAASATLPHLSGPAQISPQHPGPRCVLHQHPQPRTAVLQARAAPADAVSAPLFPQLRPTVQASHHSPHNPTTTPTAAAGAVAGTAITSLSTPTSPSTPFRRSGEEAAAKTGSGRPQRPGSLLRELRVQKEQRVGRRVGLG
jgi:hypothetical protein